MTLCTTIPVSEWEAITEAATEALLSWGDGEEHTVAGTIRMLCKHAAALKSQLAEAQQQIAFAEKFRPDFVGLAEMQNPEARIGKLRIAAHKSAQAAEVLELIERERLYVQPCDGESWRIDKFGAKKQPLRMQGTAQEAIRTYWKAYQATQVQPPAIRTDSAGREGEPYSEDGLQTELENIRSRPEQGEQQ